MMPRVVGRKIFSMPWLTASLLGGLSFMGGETSKPFLLPPAHAAQAAPTLPATLTLPATPTIPGAPPEFNKDAVAKLLADVTANQNATILKFLYFGARFPHPYPRSQGYEDLKEAVSHEPIGTERWFVLQSVRGFGGMRVSSMTVEDSLEAYDSIAKQALLAKQASTKRVLQRAWYELSVTLQGSSVEINPRSAVLEKSFDAFLQQLKQGDSQLYPIPWAPASRNLGDARKLMDLAEHALPDSPENAKRDISLILAQLAATGEPNDAAQYLESQKSVFAQDRGAEGDQYYALLVQSLVRARRWDAAIQAQQQVIERTQHGQIRLAWIQLLAGRDMEFEATMGALSSTEVPEQEVIEMLDLLKEASTASMVVKTKFEAGSIHLLSAYIQGGPKSPIAELRARLDLARILVAQGSKQEALELLQAKHLPPTSEDKLGLTLLSSIERLRSSLLNSSFNNQMPTQG